MQFFKSVILFVGVYSSYAAPANPDPAQQKFQADLKSALEPVQADMRAMVENTQSGVDDFSKSLVQSGNNILEAGKSLMTPIGKEDRANIPQTLGQRANEFKNTLGSNVRSLIDRATDDVKPVIASQKSGIFNLKSAVQILQDKYLTDDGQDLVKALTIG